jgi:hypothetical protein
MDWYRYESGKLVPIEEPPEDEPTGPSADEEDPDAYEAARGYTRALELGDPRSLWCLIFEHRNHHEWMLLLVAGRNNAYIIVTTIIDRFHFNLGKLTIKEFLK